MSPCLLEEGALAWWRNDSLTVTERGNKSWDSNPLGQPTDDQVEIICVLDRCLLRWTEQLVLCVEEWLTVCVVVSNLFN